MRFLADMGVSLLVVHDLRILGHDVAHLRDRNLQRLPDSEIIELALREDRVILTFDLDFGELMAMRRSAFPSVVIFRLRDGTAPSVSRRLQNALAGIRHALDSGSIVIVEEDRQRIRRLPLWNSGRADPDG